MSGGYYDYFYAKDIGHLIDNSTSSRETIEEIINVLENEVGEKSNKLVKRLKDILKFIELSEEVSSNFNDMYSILRVLEHWKSGDSTKEEFICDLKKFNEII